MKKEEIENNGWVRVKDSLPNALQTVFISNGKGYTAIGCLVGSEDGFHWAESNGVIYEENGEIVSECESDDIEVNFWHPLIFTTRYKFYQACVDSFKCFFGKRLS